MGCDIHGFVEVNTRQEADYSWWVTAADIGPVTGRSYDSFGCLFGVRNCARFDPVAPERGLPDDPGRLTKERYESWGRDAHSASYLAFEEIQEIDWQETAEALDVRYSILDEDKEPTGFKSVLGPASGWTEIVEENKEAIEAGEPVPDETGDRYIQRRELTREEALSGAWDWLLHDLMGLYADRYGEDSVRVVVWFDN